MAKENLHKNEGAEVVAEAVSKTDLFFKEYGKLMAIILAVLVVLGAGALCWYKFLYQPAVVEAQGHMTSAEQSFAEGDFETALNGDGNALGFAQIVEEYGSKAGKSVYLYAGICELQLGNWDSALKYLNSYKGKDEILAARAEACKGDAYVGLENYEKALAHFEKAAAKVDNMFAATYLLKAGLTAEKLGQDDKALSFYKTIKDKYPQSMEGYDVDKYIGRIENK